MCVTTSISATNYSNPTFPNFHSCAINILTTHQVRGETWCATSWFANKFSQIFVLRFVLKIKPSCRSETFLIVTWLPTWPTWLPTCTFTWPPVKVWEPEIIRSSCRSAVKFSKISPHYRQGENKPKQTMSCTTLTAAAAISGGYFGISNRNPFVVRLHNV